MVVFIIICVAFGLLFSCLVVPCIVHDVRNKKYKKYVLENSIALKQISKTNEKYAFSNYKSYDESHVYDNNVFYNNISCQDYLIYQLQFKKGEIVKDIRNINNNKKLYSLYCKEVNAIDSFGAFNNIDKASNQQYLSSIEKTLFESYKLKPVINFNIKITLYCSTINGNIYDSKSQTFDADQIMPLIKKLNNKNGDFYNDRDIWDSICRVERGKVSNKMRFSIYKRDGYRCRICGKSELSDYLEIDHIKPIAKGGKTTYDNLQTLCRNCNKEKGDTY